MRRWQTTSRMMRRWLVPVALLALVLPVSTACADDPRERDRAQTMSRYSTRDLTAPQRYGGGYIGGTATGDTRAGAAFAQWVLDQDPGRQYITDAVVRNEQTLGIKVQPTLTRRELQQLLVSLTEGMARTFPGRPVGVIAFYQSGERLAEAMYNPRNGYVDVRFG